MTTNVYILKLKRGKYYVGKSEDPIKRFNDHLSGNGSAWTKKYKPIEVELVISNASDFDEDRYVKEYMSKYGIGNVRGGSYSSITLTEEQIKTCQKEIWGANDKCFNCGGNHFVKNCLEKKQTNDNSVGWLSTLFNFSCVLNMFGVSKTEHRLEPDKHSDDEGKIIHEHIEDEKIVVVNEDVNDLATEKINIKTVLCGRCKRTNHSTNNCYAKTDINGYKLYDPYLY